MEASQVVKNYILGKSNREELSLLLNTKCENDIESVHFTTTDIIAQLQKTLDECITVKELCEWASDMYWYDFFDISDDNEAIPSVLQALESAEDYNYDLNRSDLLDMLNSLKTKQNYIFRKNPGINNS